MEYIAFDAHKHYTLASVARPDGQLVREQRIAHERGALQRFLERCERGSPVAGPLSDPFLGRTDNIDIRIAAAIALLFNVLMVVVAIIAIALTVPRDDPGVGR